MCVRTERRGYVQVVQGCYSYFAPLDALVILRYCFSVGSWLALPVLHVTKVCPQCIAADGALAHLRAEEPWASCYLCVNSWNESRVCDQKISRKFIYNSRYLCTRVTYLESRARIIMHVVYAHFIRYRKSAQRHVSSVHAVVRACCYQRITLWFEKRCDLH